MTVRRLLPLLLPLAAIAAAPPAPRPNVVLIVADDLGYGELGAYGGTEIPTPHLDRLAEEGVRFTQGYVTASVCAPSRAGLLTGRQQTRFGFEGNAIGAVNADPKVGLPAGERTLAQHLRATGYATAAIGKWHLGGTAAYHPLRRGFDEFYGFLHEGHSYAQRPWAGGVTWLRRLRLPDGGEGRWTSPDGRTVWTTHMGTQEPDYDADNPLLRGSQPVDEPQHLTDAFTREACDFIERHAGQPFFLYVAYNAVHSPLQATDRHLERFSTCRTCTAGSSPRSSRSWMRASARSSRGSTITASTVTRSSRSSRTTAARPASSLPATRPCGARRARSSRAGSACRSSCAGRRGCRVAAWRRGPSFPSISRRRSLRPSAAPRQSSGWTERTWRPRCGNRRGSGPSTGGWGPGPRRVPGTGSCCATPPAGVPAPGNFTTSDGIPARPRTWPRASPRWSRT